MFKLVTTVALAACIAPAWAAPETFELDPGHTYPGFEIDHLGFSTLRGIFKKTSGTLTLDGEAGKGSVVATVDTASLDTAHDKRDEQLRGKEFFDVAQYPAMIFKAEGFDWAVGKTSQVAGTLTLLGASRPIALTVSPTRCGVRPTDKLYTCGALVTTTLKRSEWGMKAYVPLIGDEVKIQIEVEATRRKAG